LTCRHVAVRSISDGGLPARQARDILNVKKMSVPQSSSSFFERGWFLVPLQNVQRTSVKTAAMAAKKMHDQKVQAITSQSGCHVQMRFKFD